MLSRSYFGSDVCGQLYEQYQSKNWRVTAQVAIYPVCWSCLGNDVCGQIHEQYQSQNGRVTAQVTIYPVCESCYHIHVSAVMIVGKFMSNINHVSKSHCTSSYLSSAATVSCLSLSLRVSLSNVHIGTVRIDKPAGIGFVRWFMSSFNHKLKSHSAQFDAHFACSDLSNDLVPQNISHPALFAEPSQRWTGDMKGQGRMIITTTVNSSRIPLVGVPLKNVNCVT